MPHRSHIRIRDPFILTAECGYVLYGTTDETPWRGPAVGFDHYRSVDLEHWEGPFAAFRAPEGFWATTQFWAPEIHHFAGRYWMFATFADAAGNRGTQILVADDPTEMFEPWGDGPVTPAGWKCLDGTLHVDAEGKPSIVFCHEWLQAGEGAIYAQRLAADLRSAIGEPVCLFRASEAPWTRPFVNKDTGHDRVAYIADGPFLVEEDGALLMLWSSGGDDGYAVGIAVSDSGTVLGPWRHEALPLVSRDGGHAMLIRDLEGRRLLAFHQPNDEPNERLTFLHVGDSLLATARARVPRPGGVTQ